MPGVSISQLVPIREVSLSGSPAEDGVSTKPASLDRGWAQLCVPGSWLPEDTVRT